MTEQRDNYRDVRSRSGDLVGAAPRGDCHAAVCAFVCVVERYDVRALSVSDVSALLAGCVDRVSHDGGGKSELFEERR